MTDRFGRNQWFIALLLVGAVLAASTGAAQAQRGLTDDEAELISRETALIEQIGSTLQTIDELEVERSQVLVDIDSTTAAIEGSADALEQLALDRREPAQVRLTIALERFLNGEPAQTAFTRELRALEHDSSPFQQQEVLGSIVEAAEAEIDRIDSDIRSLANTVPELQSSRESLVNDVIIIDSALLELRDLLDNSQAELQEVTESLAWYRNAASRSVLTGRTNPSGNGRPALVVKIDNVPRARPQAGINDADLVYVELVEGGVTRYAAVFHSEDVATVGPVRSMRTTDINLLRPLNEPLFANSGGNSRTTSAVNNSPLVNIGHATGAGGAYYRNSFRPAPHNLFSSTTALRRAGGTAGGAPPELFTIRRPGTELPNTTTEAAGVRVRYQNTSVIYDWNGTGWSRSQDGAATVDIAGVRTAPETVVVQFTPYGVSPADRNSPEANTVGNGKAWIFTEGALIRGSWSKPNSSSVTLYRDSGGNEIQLLPGRVWVELPKPGDATIR
jgi:hypothetical protein